jgi:hypothetical protein
MNDVTAFVPRAQANARQRIADFIALSRDRLTALVPREAWDGDVWDVSTSFVRKGKQRVVSKLHFFKYGTLSGWCGMGGGDPFEKPFAEFARAFIRYQHSAAPLGFGSLRTRIGALSHIDAAFKSLGRVSDISLLSADVLHAAVRVSRGDVSPAVRYHRAAMIRSVFLFCLEHGFIAAPFVWKHGVRKTQNIGSRIGDEPAKRRAAKLPGGEELDILALAFCEPKNVRDNLLSAVTAICICVPIRIHEVLQLSVDCGCDVERRSDKAEMVSTFGLRVLPGKHTAPQMKWLPDVMAELGRQAVSRLQQISAPARVIAEWYVRNPTKLYLPPDAQHLRQQKRLDAAVIGNLVGTVVPDKWAKAMNIPFERLTRALGASYAFEDFERAVLTQLPKDFPLHNGHPGLLYSESLVLVRRGSLRADTVGDGSRVMFEPVGIGAYGDWLSGDRRRRRSVFDRYGSAAAPTKSITSHGFRHWLNDIAHRRGMNAMDIAHWSGRDPAQNKHYDHQTPAQFHAQLRDLAEKAGGIGPLFEAADTLAPDNASISRAEFLASQIGSAHQTDLGACLHDYSLLPCQRFGDCLGCEENLFVKGDEQHQVGIEERQVLTKMQLDAARAAMVDGDYGADLWVQDHESVLRRLSLVLSIHGDEHIPKGTLVNLPPDDRDTGLSMAMRERDSKSLET